MSSTNAAMMIHPVWHQDQVSTSNEKRSLNEFSRPSKISYSSRLKVEYNAQRFAFVNTTTPDGNKEPEIRRLVRGHVVKDSSRKKRLERLKNQENRSSTNNNIVPAESLVTLPSPLPEQAEVALSFPTRGLDPHPSLSAIIYHITAIGTAMYPLVSSFKFNPISPAAWFNLALQDDALLHALLYTTSTYTGLISGTTETKESIVHVGRSVSIVKERLGNLDDGLKEPVEEGTMRAVSCLAITEALRGNVDGWKIHLDGLQRMILLKGGLAKISVTLQLKLYRADSMGAMDYFCTPYFASPNTLPSLDSLASLQPPSLPTKLRFLLDSLPITQHLRSTLTHMHTFSQTITRILSSSKTCTKAEQIALLHGTYALRYALIFYPPEMQQLDEALRISAILYQQSTPQEFPYSAVGPRNLIARLKDLVLRLKMGSRMEVELVIWMLFMAGILAKGEERAWFVIQVEKLTGKLSIEHWEIVRRGLEGLWWVRKLHEKVCMQLWEEVMISRRGLKG